MPNIRAQCPRVSKAGPRERAAPRIGVLGRDPKPDDEGRFPRPKKERAECVEKRACTKEWYKALRSIGSRGIRSHGYVTSSNTTPQTALVTPPII